MTASENRLVHALSPRDRRRLLSVSGVVPLLLSDVLYEPGRPARYVYFPISGCISLVTQIDAHPTLEVGMVGSEGMAGGPLALGGAALSVQAWVQGEGSAHRIRLDVLRREMRHSVSLQRTLERYQSVWMAQLVRAAACLRFHFVAPRLARWLLMSQDHAQADHLPMTHEFLAAMLGVRRVGVTQAVGALQGRGLIRHHRGEITVVNRAGLKKAACTCYAADRQAYDDVFPPALAD